MNVPLDPLLHLARTITPTQLAGFLRDPEVLDMLAAYPGLDMQQVDLIVDILDRVGLANRTTIAYHLTRYQRPTPRQVERLTQYVDDPDTWVLLCDQYPGGEPALRRVAPQWIVDGYATDGRTTDARS